MSSSVGPKVAGPRAPLIKKFVGLHTSPNRYAVPEGALVTATNVLIMRNGVIQPRWGKSNQVTDMRISSAPDTVTYWHRLANYKDYFVMAGMLTSGASADIATMAAASTTAPTVHLRSCDPPDTAGSYTSSSFTYDFEFLQAAGNLYFNQSSGVYRMDDPTKAYNNATNSTKIAGGATCAVACQPRPFSCTWTRSGTTVTITTPCAHGYAVGTYVQVTVSSASTPLPLGTYAIQSIPVAAPSSTATTYTITGVNSGATSGTATVGAAQFWGSSGPMTTNDQVGYRAHITQYDANGNEFVGPVSARAVLENASPYLGANTNKNMQVAVLFRPNAPLPNSKVLLYRTKILNAGDPGDNEFLVFERFLTATELASGIAWIQEFTPDTVLGRSLYTNDTQDGLNQNNLPPPAAKTISLFKEKVVLGNINERARIEMHLLSTDATNGVQTDDIIGFFGVCLDAGGSGGSRSLLATTAGSLISGSYYTIYTGGTASSDVRKSVASLIDTINWSNSASGSLISPLYSCVAYSLDVANDFPGRFAVEKLTLDFNEPDSTTYLNRFAFGGQYTTPANRHRAAWSPKPSTYQYIITSVVRTSNSTVITFTPSMEYPAVGEDITVYSDFTTRTVMQIAGTNVSGVITAVDTGLGTVTISNSGTDGSGTVTGGTYFINTYPPIANTSRAKNKVWFSKARGRDSGQYEGFAPFDNVLVGSSGKRVLKTVECYDVCLVFKEDGLYRVVDRGFSSTNGAESYVAELLDTSAILVAKDSVVRWGDKVVAWLQKGVAIIGSNGVEKYISVPIADQLRPYDLLAHPNLQRAQATLDVLQDLYELRIPGADVSVTASQPAYSATNLVYSLTHDFWCSDDLSVVAENIYNGMRYMVLNSPSSGVYPFAKQNADGQYYDGTSTSTCTTVTTYTAGTLIGGVAQPFTVHYVDGSTFTSGTLVGSYVTASPSGATGWITAVTGTGLFVITKATGTPTNADTFTAYNTYSSVIKWAPITMVEEDRQKMFRQAFFLFGEYEVPQLSYAFSTELTSTNGSQTNQLVYDLNGRSYPAFGASASTVTPVNIRLHVPQDQRRGAQLNVQLTIKNGGGTWTLWGLGVEADGTTLRIMR